MNELLIERLNYCIYVVLLLIGLHAMIAKRNLIKKLIGMSIFQTAIILFYVSVSVKEGATIPIYKAEHDPHGPHLAEEIVPEASGESESPRGPLALKPEETSQYANPLPHVLMLTAIVVGVATLGLALALCQRIYQGYGTIEEDELLAKLEIADARMTRSPLAKGRQSGKASSRALSGRKPAAKQAGGAVAKKAPAKKSSSRRRPPASKDKSASGESAKPKIPPRKRSDSSQPKKGSA